MDNKTNLIKIKTKSVKHPFSASNTSINRYGSSIAKIVSLAKISNNYGSVAVISLDEPERFYIKDDLLYLNNEFVGEVYKSSNNSKLVYKSYEHDPKSKGIVVEENDVPVIKKFVENPIPEVKKENQVVKSYFEEFELSLMSAKNMISTVVDQTGHLGNLNPYCEKLELLGDKQVVKLYLDIVFCRGPYLDDSELIGLFNKKDLTLPNFKPIAYLNNFNEVYSCLPSVKKFTFGKDMKKFITIDAQTADLIIHSDYEYFRIKQSEFEDFVSLNMMSFLENTYCLSQLVWSLKCLNPIRNYLSKDFEGIFLSFDFEITLNPSVISFINDLSQTSQFIKFDTFAKMLVIFSFEGNDQMVNVLFGLIEHIRQSKRRLN